MTINNVEHAHNTETKMNFVKYLLTCPVSYLLCANRKRFLLFVSFNNLFSFILLFVCFCVYILDVIAAVFTYSR